MTLPFMRSPRMRRHLDTLNRNQRELLVSSEHQLRGAIGKLVRAGRAGRIVLVDDIKLKGTLVLSDALPPITITAAGRSRLFTETGVSPTLSIAADDLKLEGLTILGDDNGAATYADVAVQITDAVDELRITDCDVWADECIAHDASTSATGASITNNRFRGSGDTEYLIEMLSWSDSVFSGNKLTIANSNRLGVVIDGASFVAVTGNAFGQSNPGKIKLQGAASYCTIVGNAGIDGISEGTDGFNHCAIVGNTMALAGIDSDGGGGNNTIMGNTDTGTITEKATDIINTGDASGAYNT